MLDRIGFYGTLQLSWDEMPVRGWAVSICVILSIGSAGGSGERAACHRDVPAVQPDP
jgi:hypothetical protein